MTYRLGKKQKRALLDENGVEVALFKKGEELLAFKVMELLNEKPYELGHAGDVAKKYKTTVGSLGCSQCGATQHGTFSENKCGFCGLPYFW